MPKATRRRPAFEICASKEITALSSTSLAALACDSTYFEFKERPRTQPADSGRRRATPRHPPESASATPPCTADTHARHRVAARRRRGRPAEAGPTFGIDGVFVRRMRYRRRALRPNARAIAAMPAHIPAMHADAASMAVSPRLAKDTLDAIRQSERGACVVFAASDPPAETPPPASPSGMPSSPEPGAFPPSEPGTSGSG